MPYAKGQYAATQTNGVTAACVQAVAAHNPRDDDVIYVKSNLPSNPYPMTEGDGIVSATLSAPRPKDETSTVAMFGVTDYERQQRATNPTIMDALTKHFDENGNKADEMIIPMVVSKGREGNEQVSMSKRATSTIAWTLSEARHILLVRLQKNEDGNYNMTVYDPKPLSNNKISLAIEKTQALQNAINKSDMNVKVDTANTVFLGVQAQMDRESCGPCVSQLASSILLTGDLPKMAQGGAAQQPYPIEVIATLREGQEAVGKPFLASLYEDEGDVPSVLKNYTEISESFSNNGILIDAFDKYFDKKYHAYANKHDKRAKTDEKLNDLQRYMNSATDEGLASLIQKYANSHEFKDLIGRIAIPLSDAEKARFNTVFEKHFSHGGPSKKPGPG